MALPCFYGITTKNLCRDKNIRGVPVRFHTFGVSDAENTNYILNQMQI